jgi:hypothetical protein
VYWLVVDYAALPADIQAQIINPTPQIAIMVNVPVTGQVTWEINPENLNTNAPPTQITTGTPQIVTVTPEPGSDQVTEVVVGSPAMPGSGIFSDAGDSIDDATDNSNGLTVLAIAAVGLVAVVFIARKLRTS